jgi:hypothetical protein
MLLEEALIVVGPIQAVSWTAYNYYRRSFSMLATPIALA